MATITEYSLQSMDGSEVHRSGVIANPMQLPNGDQVCGASPGWSNGDYKLVEISSEVPDPPDPVPEVISDRQFFQALAMNGSITQADALAAVKTGTLPPQLQSAIGAMPADEQFGAEMLLSGATMFERSNQMTNAMMRELGWTQENMDNLWRYAATL
jgi:hypothetical protein